MPLPGDYCQNFDQRQPHHMAWLMAVLERLHQLDPHALDRDGDLYPLWMPVTVQQPAGSWLAPAQAIVAEFEGCRLESYHCPVGVWTIGYGATGPGIDPGVRWTQQQCEQRLNEDLLRFHSGLVDLWPAIAEWPGHQAAALVSWAFNVGLGAVKSSTLLAMLRAGQDPQMVVPQQLPRWNKADGAELPGLTRRRAAEVALFQGGGTAPPLAPPPVPVKPASSVLLTVPYEFQNDNKSGTGYRECFSSSCAMVARFYGKVGSDDEYNRIRAKFGDTTDATAQVDALRSLGLTASALRTNGNAARLEQLLQAGRPVPVGWLHKGPISKPSGGGHWSVVIGFDERSFIHNDPNGEADMVGGGYVSTAAAAGRGVAYSRLNWLRRWMVDGQATGWYLDVSA